MFPSNKVNLFILRLKEGCIFLLVVGITGRLNFQDYIFLKKGWSEIVRFFKLYRKCQFVMPPVKFFVVVEISVQEREYMSMPKVYKI